ncbi:MAG TPA: tRNA (adenosine(37)-N6)-threonylcarbamoyltransferase complex ATPase subunit type 1 TsaE, partial [Candidatus Binatia bacterium]|nr:tRNA (adenosine(37)-N6)-threonylcarbamoyltransferase complex ATPase subunit type 1 TsaE [Candidatus Binatia bacterium]
LMASWSVLTGSPRQTMSWGSRLGKLLKGGEIVALIGELGAGKTCFVRGVAKGLEVGEDAWIRSPSFTLINEYQGRLPVYHIDLYRVETQAQLEGLNLREYLYSDGASLIEWFEHLPAGEVDAYLEVRVAYADGNRRQLTFSPRGQRYEAIVEGLRQKA